MRLAQLLQQNALVCWSTQSHKPSYLTFKNSCVTIISMTRQKKASKHSIEIVKQIIRAQQKLFVDPYLTDSTEIQAILHQMMHGKPHHKSIKLYQYFLEAFLHSGGGDQSNRNYYDNQKYKPTFNRVKRALQVGSARN